MTAALDFPTKRISVSGIIRDQSGKILIVKPSYRDGWLLPGGVVEPNESPVDALKREIHEELGITVTIGKLKCTDYVLAHRQYHESIHLMFDCGMLNRAEIEMLRVDGREILDFRLADSVDAINHLVPSLASRLKSVETGRTGYFQNGNPVD